MDETGTSYLFFAILLFVGALFLFWRLDKIWPGGTVVSLIAFGLFVLSFLPLEETREVSLVLGMLRITGIAGLLLGVITALRHRGKSRPAPDPGTRSTPKPQSTTPNKCPQCGLVNRTADASCKRCGLHLQRKK